MIRYARQNAPDVEFTVADVRDFSLDTRFDAAYSVYESLNHVPDIAGLTLALRRIRRHLKPGGPFLFDLNREEAYLLYWNNTDAIVENDNVCVLRSEYNEATRAARCDITAFEQSGAGEWQREDFSVRQTCHNISGAHGAVLEAGFKEVTLQDARDAGMSGDAGYARTFFLAIA